MEIPTKRSPNRSGASAHGSLLLKQVLHVPEFTCNVIGNCIHDDGYRVTAGSNSSKSRGTIKDKRGVSMAYFDRDRPLFSIKVRNQPEGPKLGPHTLKHGQFYMLSCQWPASEMKKWREYQVRNNPGSEQAPTEPPYTDAEKSFLKTHYGNEYRFLVQHGLKIYSEEDREEGRSILRAIMREDVESSDDEETEDDEFHLEGHQADYNFSEKQLDWMEKHYGNSEHFLISFGLKFYNDDDIEEAKAIVDGFLAEEE